MCMLQLVVWSPAVGNIHPGRVSLPGGACGGAVQVAEGGTPHGETSGLHTGVVSESTGSLSASLRPRGVNAQYAAPSGT